MSAAVYVLNAFVFGVLRIFFLLFRVVVVPLFRWYCTTLAKGWENFRQIRTERRAARQFRPSRKQRRRITTAATSTEQPNPELIYRALWWSLYVMAKEIPPTTFANHMAHTKPDFHEAIAYLAGQIYTVPVRFPTEIEAMVWATEIRALHGVEHRLPEVESW